jgi:hypothetical protein
LIGCRKDRYPTTPVGALDATEITVVEVSVLVSVEVVEEVTVLIWVVVETAGEVTSELHAELRSVEEKVLRGVGVVLEADVVARRCSWVVAISTYDPLLRRRTVSDATS